ncbi:hypothetical protein D3C77_367170 [compost metagenome]
MLKVLSVLFVLALLSGCENSAQDSDGRSVPRADTIGAHEGFNVRRFYDSKEGVICYTYQRSVSCLKRNAGPSHLR